MRALVYLGLVDFVVSGAANYRAAYRQGITVQGSRNREPYLRCHIDSHRQKRAGGGGVVAAGECLASARRGDCGSRGKQPADCGDKENEDSHGAGGVESKRGICSVHVVAAPVLSLRSGYYSGFNRTNLSGFDRTPTEMICPGCCFISHCGISAFQATSRGRLGSISASSGVNFPA